MAGIKSRRAWVLCLTAVGGSLDWLANVGCATGDKRAIADVGAAMRAGRLDRAVEQLTGLLKYRPHDDEAAYLLGVCEKARGQNEAAIKAWERVSSRFPFGGRAVLGAWSCSSKTPDSPRPRT